MAGESSGNSLRECDGKVGGKRKRKRKVGLLYDERMCKHDTPDGEDQPECPDRIRVIWEKLKLTGLAQRCVVLGGSKAEDKHLQLVHTKDHVKMVKRISAKQKDNRRNRIASELDSIYLNGGSSEAAYLAAGSVVEVAEKVAEGELDCGFAIVRPPGHHAEADEAMGFCLFNNVAVAASYLLNKRPDLGLKKILIVDWDVHHGNGTQKMFWEDPRVLVFSVHRHEFGSFYPTGDDGDYNMVGEGLGEGFNINVPWEQGRCGDADYLAAWDDILIPVTKEFNPDIILLSAGFDAAIGDPLGGCCVTPYGYSAMLKKGKIVMALEGGYNLDSVAKSSLACVQVLLEDNPFQVCCEEYPFESTWHVIQGVRKRLCTYWHSLADEISWKLIYQKTCIPMMVSSSSDSESEDYAHGNLRKAKPYADLTIPDSMILPIDELCFPEDYLNYILSSAQSLESLNRMTNSYERRFNKEMRRGKDESYKLNKELKTANATIAELTSQLKKEREKEKERTKEVTSLEKANAQLCRKVSETNVEKERAVAAKEEEMKTRYVALTAARDKAIGELLSNCRKSLAKVGNYLVEDQKKREAALAAALQVFETELDRDLNDLAPDSQDSMRL